MEKKMEKNQSEKIHIICEVAIMGALGFVLDTLGSSIFRGIFSSGGGISLAMLPILIIAFRRGTLAGVSTGLIVSLLGMSTGLYVLPGESYKIVLQVFLDYVLTYPLVGLAGLFRKPFRNSTKKMGYLFLILGALLGGTLKFLSQFTGGCIFWADPSISPFAWKELESAPYVYVFLYNIAYTGPSMILCMGFLTLIYNRVPFILNKDLKKENKQEVVEENKEDK